MTADTASSHDDFLPVASLKTLELRSRTLAAVRQFFQLRGYWEVETPIVSHDVVVDAYLEPFATNWFPDGRTAPDAGATASGRELYLQTSPEFGMKRLLAAGATAIYQITRAMRNAELGRYHNPEFTMIEWYRVGDSYHDQMTFVEQLVSTVFSEVGAWRQCDEPTSDRQSARFDAQPSYPRLTYDDAFERCAGTRVLALSPGQLAELARRHSIEPPPGLEHDDRDGWLNLLLAELVEPQLGLTKPEFVYDYPASQAALARIRRDTPEVAERFELYLRGIEICNGYQELTDPDELRERIKKQSAVRASGGRRELPQNNRLLAAMEAGLPPCAGVALGFDRLFMLASGATSLAQVIAFPFDRA